MLANRAETEAKDVAVLANVPEAEGAVERLGFTPRIDSMATTSS